VDAVRTLPLLTVVLMFAPNIPAQQSVSSPSTSGTPSITTSVPLFKSGVELVALNVVVTDAANAFVSGLAVSDFAVYEDGVRQNVSYFAATAAPLDLALLLDTSASMLDKIDTVQKAAIGFTATLRPNDRVTVVDMKDHVRTLHPLDGDLESAKAAIRATRTGGGTGLFNGLYMTIREMTRLRGHGEVRRQALAVLTDGDDTTSLLSFDDVMDLAKQAGIAIYTITLRSAYVETQAQMAGRRYFSQSEYGMKALAQETGARSFFTAQVEELAGTYASIADELANAYAIGYAPTHMGRGGMYRRISVHVPERPHLRVRTRNGYTTPRLARGGGAPRPTS
jgi:VWFA-related protein